jgi:lactate dehydrogenase-like 2-hydroxyacid dehydrogenase
MKLIVLDSATLGETSLEEFRQFGELEVFAETLPEKRIERIRGKEVVITNKVLIDKGVMDGCPELKLICVAATGMNNVDLEYASNKGISVKNVAGYSTLSVAQTTFSLVLAMVGHIGYFDSYVKSGKYASSPIFTHLDKPFYELAGKEFGIIGFGTIGKAVARLAVAFGCKVSYYSTSGKNSSGEFRRLEMNELLSQSDIISIHAPLNDNTRGLIQYSQLCLMKSSAILLNMGRGGIVSEIDLVRALNENKFASAALDVYEREPLPADSPLLQLSDPGKIMLTPHIAWASVEARALLVKKIADNIRDFMISQDREL